MHMYRRYPCRMDVDSVAVIGRLDRGAVQDQCPAEKLGRIHGSFQELGP